MLNLDNQEKLKFAFQIDRSIISNRKGGIPQCVHKKFEVDVLGRNYAFSMAVTEKEYNDL